MGRVDIATKRFVSIVDVFAQLFNVGLFQGDIVVKEDGLTDMNPLEDMRLEKGKVSKKLDLRERIRDVKKKSDLGFTLAILGAVSGMDQGIYSIYFRFQRRKSRY